MYFHPPNWDIFNYLSTFQFYGFSEDYSFKPYKYLNTDITKQFSFPLEFYKKWQREGERKRDKERKREILREREREREKERANKRI